LFLLLAADKNTLPDHYVIMTNHTTMPLNSVIITEESSFFQKFDAACKWDLTHA